MLFALLFLLLAIWVVVGVLLHLLIGRNPTGRRRALVRAVNRRLCVEGDLLTVRLTCHAEALPAVRAVAPVTPWDIVLVIDHSGSMGSGTGSALYEARKAAVTLISTTPEAFRFAVVAFDHEARAVCPLTERRRCLVRAIDGIHRGGATDIALGLAVADRALPTGGLDDERRRAVILLSDGGSDDAPAIAAADRLKEDPDLLLITVGIGTADMSLLRQLASTPGHCYHTGQIQDLTALYGQIGEMMTGGDAREVRLTEHFPHAGAFALRDWGELPPAEPRLREFEAAWLFPALHPQTPIAVDYRVEAVCPGWQRVAPRPARLQARLADDSAHESLSNQGPRVLVLPRIPGWQLLWVLLNPLFFLLFGRSLCQQQGVVARAPIAPPHPRPFLPPPPLEPAALTNEPALAPRPTLVLGLGYAGTHVLTHCKRLAWERTGRLDLNRLRFLAVDTADETFFPSPRAGLVGLATDERLTLDQPLELLIATAAAAGACPHYPWLDAAALAAGGARPDLHRGTGGQRTLGRLAAAKGRDALAARLAPLLDALIAQADSGGIDILVVIGSGGGTGTGALLEVCWLLRHLLTARHYGDSATTVFLTAPDASRTLPSDPVRRTLYLANQAALLAELDRIAVLRTAPLAPAPDLPALPRWVDRVCLIAPADRATWPAEEVLYPKAGETLFTWLASAGRGGLRDHFLALDAGNNASGRTLGRCLLHRLDPVSHYLFPHTLKYWLCTDTLRRTLAGRLWGITAAGFTRYGVGPELPAGAATLLEGWLQDRDGGTDSPWVFDNLALLTDANRLQEALHLGGGPEISTGIAPLARNELFEEQRMLVRHALDTWVQDSLNRGWPGVCTPHALALCLGSMRVLVRRLREEATPVAAHLASTSTLARVRREAETVAELASQALNEVETLLRRLADWDARLGEGSGGLLRLLDERSGALRAEVSRLQDPAGDGRSPRLPLTEEQLAALPGRFLADLDKHLSERMQWQLTRNDNQLQLCLVLHGTTPRTWIPEDMGLGDKATVALADALLDLTWHLGAGYADWSLADYPADNLPAIRVDPPRADQLNPGARGCYLRQGEGHFDARAHVEQDVLTPFDHREARLISTEENLASHLLLAPRTVAAPLPFVFVEEQNAYRGYLAYCLAERLLPDALPASLVGLCGDPDALLAFALVGLGESRIALRDDGLRNIWYASTGDGAELVLAEAAQTGLETLVRVAAAWIARADAGRLQVSAARGLSAADLAQRLGGHPLAIPVAEHIWFTQFIAVVWGLLQWR